MYKIKNTADDRSKVTLHRTATKFELEPSFAGLRLRLGQSRLIEDEVFQRNEELLRAWEKNGMISIEKEGDHETTVPGLPGDPGLEPPSAPPPEPPQPIEVPPPEPPMVEVPVGEPAVVEPVPEVPTEPEPSHPQSKKGPGRKKLF